ncbi:uncharacterized protein LOC126560933 [Anopheles maculipalpis]|uniref:uncharacterized protein LOC126560933 n=1 Tax=Anopheles maculipalpis TaxID=1496333 RepID=UPI002159978D|nr:uncharacterized protein LOC126560933 [Anopheles maculipalpis]
MIKFICLLALVAVVAALPNGPIEKREVAAPEAVKVAIEKEAPAIQESAVEAKDDMDKAETFGFGYHKVIHVGVPYYSGYHHYPRYYHGGYHGGYGYHGYGHYW